MTNFKDVPWDKIVDHLRDEVVQASGTRGALLGAGLGAASAIANLNAKNKPVSPLAVLAASLVGLAIGAADKSVIGAPEGE